MSDIMDKTRLLVAKRRDEEWPMVIAAMPESTSEVFDQEDWDQWKRDATERMFGPDWMSYDVIEVVMTFPVAEFRRMFEAREIAPVSVELGGE